MSGDEKADFEALFLDTRAPLLGYLDRRVPSEDAVDLLAEVYLIAWRKRSSLPRGDERRLWLFGVARRLVAEHHRSTPRRTGAAQVWGSTAVPAHLPPSDRRGEAVRTAVASLNDVDRELITLTTWDRLSSSDAARIVGITSGTARVRLHRARARLARDPRLRSLLDQRESEAREGGTTTPGGDSPPPPGRSPSPRSCTPWTPA